jgi:hypothetical protein
MQTARRIAVIISFYTIHAIHVMRLAVSFLQVDSRPGKQSQTICSELQKHSHF